MITILAKIKALYNDSKRYHWQCNGKDFNGDHQLFDRAAGTFSNDVVDGLVEIYYMGEHREELEDLNELAVLVSEEEGYIIQGHLPQLVQGLSLRLVLTTP